MDCIYRITSIIKKVGFGILLAELAVIAYYPVTNKQDLVISSNNPLEIRIKTEYKIIINSK